MKLRIKIYAILAVVILLVTLWISVAQLETSIIQGKLTPSGIKGDIQISGKTMLGKQTTVFVVTDTSDVFTIRLPAGFYKMVIGSPNYVSREMSKFLFPFIDRNIGVIKLDALTDLEKQYSDDKVDSSITLPQGGGEIWRVFWNERTGSPHRVLGSSIEIGHELSESNIDSISKQQLNKIVKALAKENDDFENFSIDALQLEKTRKMKDAWIAIYKQRFTIERGRSVPIYSTQAGLTIQYTKKAAKIVQYGMDIFPKVFLKNKTIKISSLDAINLAIEHLRRIEQIELSNENSLASDTSIVVFPLSINLKKTDFYLAYKVDLSILHPLRPSGWRVFVDAENGAILFYENRTLDFKAVKGKVFGTIYPEKPPIKVRRPIFNIQVCSGYPNNCDLTDIDGMFTLKDISGKQISLRLENEYFFVREKLGGPIFERTANPADSSILFPHSQYLNSFYQCNTAKNYIKTRARDFDPTRIFLDVYNFETLKGAFFNGLGALYFGVIDDKRTSFYSDVVMHEYAHAVINELVDLHFGEAGALNEGLADYFACSMNNDATLDPIMRTAKNHLTFENFKSEPPTEDNDYGHVHDNSQIILGVLWDLRQAKGISADLVDYLVLKALAYYPPPVSFKTLGLNMLLADDIEDGKLYNGTPHYKQIIKAFEGRGITMPNFDINAPSIYLLTSNKKAIEAGESITYEVAIFENGSGLDQKSVDINLVERQKKLKFYNREANRFKYRASLKYPNEGDFTETIHATCADKDSNVTKMIEKVEVTVGPSFSERMMKKLLDWGKIALVVLFIILIIFLLFNNPELAGEIFVAIGVIFVTIFVAIWDLLSSIEKSFKDD